MWDYYGYFGYESSLWCLIQENSTKRGLLYVIASASIFDEYTNDLLYLQEGSRFPRYVTLVMPIYVPEYYSSRLCSP
jgi:hypothetical protein